MGTKETAKKLLLAMATAGLTTCDGVGAVDPAPPPLNCDDVSGGQMMSVTGKLNGSTLELTINYFADYGLQDPTSVTAVSGLTIDSVDSTDLSAIAVLATLDMGVTEAKFTVTSKVSDGDTTCNVLRTFTATITNGEVKVAEVMDLPLLPRRHASIEMMRRDGLEVELHAAGAAGASVAWTPTGGAVEAAEGGRARWRLPAEPGVYQVEMLIDRGDDGFQIDTLTLEVVG